MLLSCWEPPIQRSGRNFAYKLVDLRYFLKKCRCRGRQQLLNYDNVERKYILNTISLEKPWDVTEFLRWNLNGLNALSWSYRKLWSKTASKISNSHFGCFLYMRTRSEQHRIIKTGKKKSRQRTNPPNDAKTPLSETLEKQIRPRKLKLFSHCVVDAGSIEGTSLPFSFCH